MTISLAKLFDHPFSIENFLISAPPPFEELKTFLAPNIFPSPHLISEHSLKVFSIVCGTHFYGFWNILMYNWKKKYSGFYHIQIALLYVIKQ